MAEANESLSKYLSYILRHKPDEIGLQLDAQGWADIAELLAKSGAHGRRIESNALVNVVENSTKKRLVLSDDRTRIRALQGHSIPVELGLQPVPPPSVLYHGTPLKYLSAILASGLQKQARHQVHLSSTVESPGWSAVAAARPPCWKYRQRGCMTKALPSYAPRTTCG